MSITNEQILDAVAEMSVMQVVELIEAMEEKFGVSAAAAVAVAGPAAKVVGLRRVCRDGLRRLRADLHHARVQESRH